MKIVSKLIATRFQSFGSWFETSVHFLWVLLFQEGSNPLQTTVRNFDLNAFFANAQPKNLIKNLKRSLRSLDGAISWSFILESTSSYQHWHSEQQKSQHSQTSDSTINRSWPVGLLLFLNLAIAVVVMIMWHFSIIFVFRFLIINQCLPCCRPASMSFNCWSYYLESINFAMKNVYSIHI